MVNETKDWEKNPHLYLQDDDGNFILKKDGTPKKKAGRPQTSTEKAIKAARATVGRKQRNIKKLNKSLTMLDKLLRNKKKQYKNLTRL